jgi:hypothetical protein
MSDCLSPRGGRHHFLDATSLSMALSSIASARNFFSLAFSSSSAFSRLASGGVPTRRLTNRKPKYRKPLLGERGSLGRGSRRLVIIGNAGQSATRNCAPFRPGKISLRQSIGPNMRVTAVEPCHKSNRQITAGGLQCPDFCTASPSIGGALMPTHLPSTQELAS